MATSKSPKKTLIIFIITLIFFALIIPYLIPLSDSKKINYSLPFPESNLVKVNKVLLHYREWVPESKVAGKVLFIHGLGGSTYSWRNNIDQLLKSGYLVITMDLPAFGYSDRKLLNHSQENRAKLTWELLTYIDNYLFSEVKTFNWHLVGHSMGSGTVMAMAVENPDRVQSLAFVAGAIYQQSNSLIRYLFFLPSARRWLGLFIERFLLNKKNIESSLTQAYGRKPTRDEVDKHLEPLVMPGTAKAFTNLVLTAKNLTTEKLKKYPGPIIGIWGSEDSWVKPEFGRRLKEELVNAEYQEIKGAYHCPMETHSEIFNEILINFLNTNN